MQSQLPLLETPRLFLRLASLDDVPEIVRYYRSNQLILAPVEPRRPDNFLTPTFWQAQVRTNLWDFQCDRTLKLFLFKREHPLRVIGSVNFSQITRGAAYHCVLGYSLAESEQHQGYMTEALKGAIAHMFDTVNMHRIMANYMPRNQRSGNLLRRLGFVVEGYARDYLLINGTWEDHILTSLTHQNWRPQNNRH
jgi:ribosomal-protein-alanine N-acetyltransferase